MHVMAILYLTLKAEVVFTCNINYVSWVKFIALHVSLIVKSNSENRIKIP